VDSDTVTRLRLQVTPSNSCPSAGGDPRVNTAEAVARGAHAALATYLPELALVCALAGGGPDEADAAVRLAGQVSCTAATAGHGPGSSIDVDVPVAASPHAVAAAIAAMVSYGLETGVSCAQTAYKRLPMPATAKAARGLLGSSQSAHQALGSGIVDYLLHATDAASAEWASAPLSSMADVAPANRRAQ
jgi:hypothetical protein